MYEYRWNQAIFQRFDESRKDCPEVLCREREREKERERERERERESERERCSIYNFTKEEPLTNLGEVKKNQSSKGAHEYNFSE